MSDIDRWEQADELYFAVNKFADVALRERFRAAKGERAFWSIRLEMYLWLYDRLVAGELEALGVMLLPTPSTDIVSIPSHIFTVRPIVEDCDQNVVSSAARKYEFVRVREIDREGASHSETDEGAAPKPSKRGPKPLDPLIAAAIRVLEAEDALIWQRSQEKRIEIIRSKVAEMNPGRFPKQAKPGHTTIHRYLQKIG